AAMNRPTLLAAADSGVGVHAAATAPVIVPAPDPTGRADGHPACAPVGERGRRAPGSTPRSRGAGYRRSPHRVPAMTDATAADAAPDTATTPPGAAERLVWIDLEMTGLDTERHTIVEIAVLVTDGTLELVDDGIDLVIHAT